jgi:hypothetical protein
VKLRALGLGSACVAAVGVAVALAAPAVTTGCETNQCNPEYINTVPDAGVASGYFRTLDPATGLTRWESVPVDGTWDDFPGGAIYFFGFGGSNFEAVEAPLPYVSTDPIPYAADASGAYVQAGGQLAELSSANFSSLDGFKVTNSTCAHYYLYVSVLGIIPPPAPAPPPADAGTDAPGDAPADASADGDAGTGD